MTWREKMARIFIMCVNIKFRLQNKDATELSEKHCGRHLRLLLLLLLKDIGYIKLIVFVLTSTLGLTDVIASCDKKRGVRVH